MSQDLKKGHNEITLGKRLRLTDANINYSICLIHDDKITK